MDDNQLARHRIRLTRKQKRLNDTNGRFFLPKLKRFVAFLKSDPLISPILAELNANSTGRTAAGIVGARGSSSDLLPGDTHDFIDRLDNENDVAAFYYHILQGIYSDTCKFEELNMRIWGSHVPNMTDFTVFKPEVLGTLCDYIADKLDEHEGLVGLLVRYKKRCEWFNRDDLWQIAEKEQARLGDDKKRAEVENTLKLDLYRYLYDQGMDFTIEPYSHRGRIDLILDQREGVRKYLEGKVFDNQNRNAAYISKGFGQLIEYLRQYNAPTGYLLVYKTCKEQLVIDGADKFADIPFVRCEGKVVYFLLVDLCQYDEPVSQRTYKTIRILVEQLTKGERPSQGSEQTS
jgi:hypothetical protein